MKRSVFTAALAAMIALCLFVVPSYGKGVISAKELAEISKDDNVLIVSTRSAEDYAKVHIKGAIHVNHKDLYLEGDVKGLLKSPEEMAEYLGTMGISESNTIVLYDGGKNNTSGRLYWVLEYLGCDDVMVLNGQMKQWRKARKPVTKKTEEVAAATFTASPDETMIATADDVRTEGVLVVDVRTKEEFDGEKGETSRKGHIPGAANFDYTSMFNEDGTIKTDEELTELFQAAGITSDKDIILYCDTSVRAGITYLALDSILGFTKVRVYDGALFEWTADPNNPLE